MQPSSGPTQSARGVASITFVGLLVAFGVIILSGRYDPIELMWVGEQSPVAALVDEQYGPGVVMEGNAGYDGAYFWAAADQLPDLDAAASYMDDAPYRLQRILPSAIAALAGGGDASALALILVSIAGVAVTSGALADLASRHGRATALGLLAIVPLVYSIFYSTGEPLAFALGFLGLCAADRRRHALAIVLLSLGTLSRESVAVFGLGVALGLVVGRFRGRDVGHPLVAAAYLVPLAVDLGWASFLRDRYESGEVIDRITPFGVLDASTSGLLLGFAIVALGILGAWLWRDVDVVWGVALGFAAGIFLYYGPLFIPRAILRVSAPAIALGLSGLIGRRRAATPAVAVSSD